MNNAVKAFTGGLGNELITDKLGCIMKAMLYQNSPFLRPLKYQFDNVQVHDPPHPMLEMS